MTVYEERLIRNTDRIANALERLASGVRTHKVPDESATGKRTFKTRILRPLVEDNGKPAWDETLDFGTISADLMPTRRIIHDHPGEHRNYVY